MTPYELELKLRGAMEEDERIRTDGALRSLAVVRGFNAKDLNMEELFHFMMHDQPEINKELLAESKQRVKDAEIEKMKRITNG